MLSLALTLAILVLLHLPGLRGLGGRKPADRAALALGLALVVPGVLHFVQIDEYVRRVPSYLPARRFLVQAGGFADLVLAAGLLLPRTRSLAGWGAVVLFLIEWPAILGGAISGEAESTGLVRWLRAAVQPVLMGWGSWCALGHLPGLELRRRLFARFYDSVQTKYETWMGARKRPLLSPLRGRVLELGPGTGVNFSYLDPSITWTGVEPNPWMRDRLVQQAWSKGFGEVAFRDITDEGLDVPDQSFDIVLSTLVLCSVPDPEEALREIQRVLIPGGRFVFVEHVAAPRGTRLRRVQNVLRPFWSCMADGCEPNRELAPLIRRAGFAKVELEDFRVPKKVGIPVVAPHVTGVAWKAGA